MINQKECVIDGCDKQAKSRGWCSAHYMRWRRHGDPTYTHPLSGPAKCGTYGGYQAHRRRDEDACEPCKEASRLYMEQYRSEPSYRSKENRRNAARNRALWRLAQEYPEQFETFVVEELRRAVS